MHTAISICHTGFADCLPAGSGWNFLIPLPSCQQTCMTYTYCCVHSEKTPDYGQRNCPKNIEFYSKSKFERLVHLVGFIIRIYQYARSYECEMSANVRSTYPFLATPLQITQYVYGV